MSQVMSFIIDASQVTLNFGSLGVKDEFAEYKVRFKPTKLEKLEI